MYEFSRRRKPINRRCSCMTLAGKGGAGALNYALHIGDQLVAGVVTASTSAERYFWTHHSTICIGSSLSLACTSAIHQQSHCMGGPIPCQNCTGKLTAKCTSRAALTWDRPCRCWKLAAPQLAPPDNGGSCEVGRWPHNNCWTQHLLMKLSTPRIDFSVWTGQINFPSWHCSLWSKRTARR